jgi:hypothetical protein
MSRIDKILGQLPVDPENSLKNRPVWLLSTETVFPEDISLPKIEPVISAVALNADRPKMVEVTTNLGVDMDGLTALALAEALNQKINSKVVTLPSDDNPGRFELLIASEQLSQVVEEEGMRGLMAIAANHDLVRAAIPGILADIGQNGTTDLQELMQKANSSVKSRLENPLGILSGNK